MSTQDTKGRNFVRGMTLLVPLAAIALLAPLSACSKKVDAGPLAGRDLPLYRPIRSETAKQLADLEKKTAEKYKDTGSRAFAREAERRYKKGRKVTEVGMSRPGMSAEDQKAWDEMGKH